MARYGPSRSERVLHPNETLKFTLGFGFPRREHRHRKHLMVYDGEGE